MKCLNKLGIASELTKRRMKNRTNVSKITQGAHNSHLDSFYSSVLCETKYEKKRLPIKNEDFTRYSHKN